MIEAMKMQTNVYAPISAKVIEVVQVGETVDAKDLLMILSPAT